MISVIIPTLDEEDRLPNLLAALAGEAADHEVIVADGGSGDRTVAVARRASARVVAAPRGRGNQLRAGAREATGEILLFLHADNCFPAGGLGAIERALAADSEAVGGNFRLLFDGDDAFSRWLDDFYAWIRARGIYYGDSGVFVRRAVHERIGGVRAIALMEDFDFVRKLEKAGRTLSIVEPAMVTSSRRFEGRRPAAIIWGWIKIHLMFYLGVRPQTLARIYNSERR